MGGVMYDQTRARAYLDNSDNCVYRRLSIGDRHMQEVVMHFEQGSELITAISTDWTL